MKMYSILDAWFFINGGESGDPKSFYLCNSINFQNGFNHSDITKSQHSQKHSVAEI